MSDNTTLSALPSSLEVEKIYIDIYENLESLRLGFIKTLMDEDQAALRTANEAGTILQTLKTIALSARELFSLYPSLETLFEDDFGSFKELLDRQFIAETCFLDDYLFPRVEQAPFVFDGTFHADVVSGYITHFQEWSEDRKKEHKETQEKIKSAFSLKINPKDLSCHCHMCQGDYRTKLREFVWEEQVRLIDEAEEKLYDVILRRSMNDVSASVFHLKKQLDKSLHQIRTRLKRSTVNKLEADVKAYYKTKFSSTSQLSKTYREKCNSYFNSVLVDMGYKPEMISDEEYDRFYLQLEVGIWKPEGLLRKEFEKFVSSVLTLKRKDISSTILRNYLGQFWIHAEARKMKRRFVYHMGPTNSGKTYHAIEALCKAKNGCYLAPLRLLAAELYDTMNQKGVVTTLLTGEEVIDIPGATHFSSTIEMAKLHAPFECAVIDEIQMINDPQRGWAWTRALVNLNAVEIHLCGDHSVLELVKKILKLTGDTLEIKDYQRMTELRVMNRQLALSELERSDALVVFSRRNALKFKADLENLDFKVSIVYGRLSPEVRREQARKFDFGETDIMVATDAIAMGMNLPVKRIVFSALSKFVDNKEIPLTMSEIKQISGRAGRFKRFPIGEVTTLLKVEGGLDRVAEAIQHNLTQKEKAMVGPDLEIFSSVNSALEQNNLTRLKLSEFLRLFNTMSFENPFFCTDLREMIEIAEMVEQTDSEGRLSTSEVFGFACAPVNLGLLEHVQYFLWILKHYSESQPIFCEPIDTQSDNIDYLETSIKCVELYQWLARHFAGKHFDFIEQKLLENKAKAVDRLNEILSDKTTKACSSCGCSLPVDSRFSVCDACFQKRRRERPAFKRNREEGAQGSGARPSGGPRKPSGEGRSSVFKPFDRGPKKGFKFKRRNRT
jgi:ATP-dependent RNA helicase SUPV3L1/SUV3